MSMRSPLNKSSNDQPVSLAETRDTLFKTRSAVNDNPFTDFSKTNEMEISQFISRKLMKEIEKEELEMLKTTLESITGESIENKSEAELLDQAKSLSIADEFWKIDVNKAKYHIGLCGDLCVKTLEILKDQQSITTTRMKVMDVKGTGEHYYLECKSSNDNIEIIEPTYRQFLYRIFVDPGTHLERKNQISPGFSNQACIAKIDALPSVFVGKKEDLIKQITSFLEALQLDKQTINEATHFWKPTAHAVESLPVSFRTRANL
jgi:hypothetical protein